MHMAPEHSPFLKQVPPQAPRASIHPSGTQLTFRAKFIIGVCALDAKVRLPPFFGRD
jgi:hypothetical protein